MIIIGSFTTCSANLRNSLIIFWKKENLLLHALEENSLQNSRCFSIINIPGAIW